MVLTALLGLALSTPAAHAGCADGTCTLPESHASEASMVTHSSLELRPAAHLRTATFALG